MYKFSNEMLEMLSDMDEYEDNSWYKSSSENFDESTFCLSVESDWNSSFGCDDL